MGYYIRKITRSKWPSNLNEKVELIQADAITGCTRTHGNKLSLWKVDNINNEIEDVMTIITSFEKPNRCEFVYISEDVLAGAGIKVEKSTEDANTALSDKKDTHYNAIVNDYNGLGAFGGVILKSLGNYKRFNDRQVKEKLKEMLKKNEIKEESLNSKMLKYLQ